MESSIGLLVFVGVVLFIAYSVLCYIFPQASAIICDVVGLCLY